VAQREAEAHDLVGRNVARLVDTPKSQIGRPSRSFTGLVRGADASLTIVVSASRPGETDVNWLPAPTGAFSLVLRVYDPTPQVLDGSWTPPVIRAIS
jgi:hypothetical protein